MRSAVLVTSWWSNSLALTCLTRLVKYAPQRKLFVSQAGKSKQQMERFRKALHPRVTEILYPEERLQDDAPMREYLARIAMAGCSGVWFFDHDTFLEEPTSRWFANADRVFKDSGVCLCTRPLIANAGITQPAYWLSPSRWPEALPSFNPVPFTPKPFAARPDLHRCGLERVRPGKDTLVAAKEALDRLALTDTLLLEEAHNEPSALPRFPRHQHLGGLHLYSGALDWPGDVPEPFLKWQRHIIHEFERFFQSCPQTLLSIEEPELLRRHCEFHQTVFGMPSALAQ